MIGTLKKLGDAPTRDLSASSTHQPGLAAAAAGPDGTALTPASDLSFLAAPQSADELGRLGPYRVLEVLGAGAMGVVFRAEDPQLSRPVALKVMMPTLVANARAKLLREAKAAAAVKHEHVVAVHQVGEDRGIPFLAMEFLDGETLDDRLEREPRLPIPEVLRIGREIAEGLEAVHERGLVHRDIKPANLWLEGRRGRVKVLDFGVAWSATEGQQMTQAGAIVGTPPYMAPEQAQGKTLDQRCDLFSLGCVLYRMTTGNQPFSGPDAISTLMAVKSAEPLAPMMVNFEVPAELSDLIMSLLAKSPDARPDSAHEVAVTLDRLARGEPAAVVDAAGADRKPPAPAQARSAGKHRRRLVASIGIAACAVAAIFCLFLL